MRLRQEKIEIYQAAVNLWKNGEVSQALSRMRDVLELDRKAPDATSPDATGTYQSLYDKIQSEHDAINNGYAEARRHIEDRKFAPALQICQTFLTKYPGHALFQALKFDIRDAKRRGVPHVFISTLMPLKDGRLGGARDLVIPANDEIRLHNPRLPAFLDEVVLRDLRLGKTSVDLKVRRHASDVSVEILERRGPIQVAVVFGRTPDPVERGGRSPRKD